MGISDDIRPKRNHPIKESHIPIRETEPDEDDFDFEIENEPEEHHPIKRRLNYEALEDIENDFFDNKKQIKREEKIKKTKHKSNKNRTKLTFWLMTGSLIVLLLWQNYSELYSAAKKMIGKENVTATNPVEDSSDEYYTAEPATSSGTTGTTAVAAPVVTTPTTTATTATAVDKASVKIEVLNGNGIQSSGSKIKAELVAGGFSVARTANAKNFNYATSIIYYKTGQDAEAAAVKDAITSKTATLEKNDTLAGDYDVIVVVGAK